ncbi:MAG: DUF805 domain-containing protein [Endozoicomonadaceae bacterium]|nr:DUF805 domain-containing protein [Endozoicomonadaceae bacterium]
MDTTRYKIVFDGQTQPDYPPEQVKRNITLLFQAQTPQIEQLFSGQPVIIKKNLSQNEAKYYEETITRAGAVCRIIVQKPEPPSTILDTIREIPPWNTTQKPKTSIALSPKGRLGRAYFIVYASLLFLLATALSATLWMLAPDNNPVVNQSVYIITPTALLFLAILACIPLQIRRLHDIGHIGWLSLISLTPFTNIPFLLYIALRLGHRGKNHYGEQPKQPPSLINLLAIGLPILLIVISGLIVSANLSELQSYWSASPVKAVSLQ